MGVLWLKRVIVGIVRAIFTILPFHIFLAAVARCPRLDWCTPRNRRMVYEKYLGDVKVNIDTFYRIEAQMLTGRYDPVTFGLIGRLVRPGDWCLDIGANVGAVTFALAKKVGVGGRVFAFEPGGLTFQRLSANLALNPGLAQVVQPEKLGLGEKEDVLFWNEDPKVPGNAGFLGARSQQRDGEACRITTVDRFFAQHPPEHIDFAKIDVEGMELEVIRGGLETWKRYLPTLYYETLWQFESLRNAPVFLQIAQILQELGYVIFRVEEGGRIVETTYPNLSPNTLAVHKSRMSQLGVSSKRNVTPLSGNAVPVG